MLNSQRKYNSKMEFI